MRKKWLLTALFTVLLLPIILVVAVLTILNVTDLSQHRDTIAEQISNTVGRRLSLDGELELNIASTTRFVVSDITLANADWASDPEMLAIQRFEVEIELLPLLRGDIHIPHFHLEGVKASLETDATGNGSWVLAEPVDDTVVDDETVSPTAFELPWLGDIYIGNVDFKYLDTKTGRTISAKLDQARVHADTLESPTTIDIQGQVNSEPVEINGTIALPTVFTVDKLDLPIELHARVLGLKADVSGKISGPADSPAIDFNLQAEAASSKHLRDVFGDAVPEVKPIKLVMAIKGEQGQPVSGKLNASAGKARLEAELNLQRDQPRPNLTGTLAISDVDVVRLWAPYFTEQPAQGAVERPQAAASKPPQQLDQAPELAWLDSLDANVLLSVKRINLPQMPIQSLQSRLIIDGRLLKVDELELITDAGTATSTLSLNARETQTAARLDLKTSTVKLDKLQALAKNERFKHGRVEAEIALSAQGVTVAGLIESLQGDIQLDYSNRQRKEKLSVNLTRNADQKTADKIPLLVTADGNLDKQVIALRGHVTPPTGLLKSRKPYAVDLDLQAFGVSGKVTGTAAALYTLDGLDLAVEAQAKNLDGLRQAFGQDIPKLGQIDLSVRIQSDRSKLRLSALRIGMVEGHIDGWLVLDTSATIPDLESELVFTDLNLKKLLPAQQESAKKKQAADKQKTSKTAKSDKVFSDEPLPIEMLSRANIRATLRAINLLGPNNRRLKEAEVRVTLDKAKLTASLLKLSSVKGKLAGDFVVDAGGKAAPRLSLKLKAPRIELGELLTTADGTTAVEGPLAVDIVLEGQGRSVAQIMATLNGNVNLLMEEGSADAKGLDIIVGGLGAMLGTIFTEQSTKTRIRCAICDLKFEKGTLTPELALLDTQYSTVFAEGKVDLTQEQLDLKVSPNAKGVTLSVAFPVRLKGSLSQPNVEVEKTGALLKATELWATVVYPPAALVKFSDLGEGKENPCVSMVAEKAGIPILEDVGKAVKKTVKGVGGAVKGVGSGLGKLLGKDKDDATAPTTADDADKADKADEAESEDTEDPDLFMDY